MVCSRNIGNPAGILFGVAAKRCSMKGTERVAGFCGAHFVRQLASAGVRAQRPDVGARTATFLELLGSKDYGPSCWRSCRIGLDRNHRDRHGDRGRLVFDPREGFSFLRPSLWRGPFAAMTLLSRPKKGIRLWRNRYFRVFCGGYLYGT